MYKIFELVYPVAEIHTSRKNTWKSGCFLFVHIFKSFCLWRDLFWMLTYFVIFWSFYSWWWWVQFSAKWINQTEVLCKSNWILGLLSKWYISDCKMYVCSSFYRKPNLLNMQKISWFWAFFHTQFFRFDLKMSFSLVRYQTADISSQGFNSECSDTLMKR